MVRETLAGAALVLLGCGGGLVGWATLRPYRDQVQTLALLGGLPALALGSALLFASAWRRGSGGTTLDRVTRRLAVGTVVAGLLTGSWLGALARLRAGSTTTILPQPSDSSGQR